MKPGIKVSERPGPGRFFSAAFGLFLGLTLLKFGNPPIMEKWVTAPSNVWQFVLWSPWPISWAYALLGVVTLAGLWRLRWKLPDTRAPLVLLLLWVSWQFAAALGTVDMELTGPTLAHFVGCVVCFALGCWCLPSYDRLGSFFVGVLGGYLLVLAIGFQQQFGGLEATRRYFYAEVYPQMTELPPGYLKKISSPRIFSTLFYPNALAGLILLLLPAVLVLLIQLKEWFTSGARAFLVASVALGSLACLVWSGSKGGWLLMLLIALIALLRLTFDRRLKLLMVGLALIVGISGFAWKYHSFFRKGATSIVARFDYWDAAIRTAIDHPWFGTGPGTFAKPYQVIKRPESEMARLTHNDYLEQASDSGWLGFIAYAGFIAGLLVCTYPRACPNNKGGSASAKAVLHEAAREAANPRFALWLGVLAWALQSLFEFGLYIPALAWPAFCFMGLLAGYKLKSAS